ncbi:MAG: HEPN domain-containing protein [Candidatus Promineofilum sp.]|nr:HEPN domain-containing protein [Promineifilum sp.]
MTQSVDDYLRQAEDSLAAAELLLSEDFAGYAAARAYYGMFYVAQAFLATRGLASSKHSGVVGMFGHEFAKSGVLPEHSPLLIRAARRWTTAARDDEGQNARGRC